MCAVEGCSKKSRSAGSAHCEMHYYRLRRNGTLTAKSWHRRTTCTAAGCEKREVRNGLCGQHDYRMAVHGTIDGYTPHWDRNMARGERHPNWTGSEASYYAAHQRVQAVRGSARLHRCIDCEAPAQHWSYNHDDPEGRVSEQGLPYSPDPAHYSPRCVSCHKRFDLARKRVS